MRQGFSGGESAALDLRGVGLANIVIESKAGREFRTGRCSVGYATKNADAHHDLM
jgi:hypothetical protein